MFKELTLAVVQALTEFLPLSSSGHLALFSGYFGEIDLFYFTVLHFASLLALVYFTRKEIMTLLSPKTEESRRLWLYLFIGILPAGIFGLFFKSFIEKAFDSPFAISIGFLFTGTILTLCLFFQDTNAKPSFRSSIVVGLSQLLALFPGVSRSGTTISFGLFTGLKREEAFRFSFLMAIPLIFGALLLESGNAYFSWGLVAGFLLCTILSFYSLKLLEIVLKNKHFWVFGIYCLTIGLILLLKSLGLLF